MLFVPLPLFAALLLVLAFVRFCTTRDLRQRPHQLFALLVALYAAQSFLSSLRWGYELEAVSLYMMLLAPLLPVTAFLAYNALSGRQSGVQLWPLALIAANWMVFAIAPDLSDPVILMTYIGLGGLLVQLGLKGIDKITLSPISEAGDIRVAIFVTGASLIASGLTDLYIIYDFVQNAGRNAALVITFVQTGFVLVIGAAGIFGRSSKHTPQETAEHPLETKVSKAESDIVFQLEHLFETERIYRDEDLSLRRLARRIGVPDRHVSQAINRVRNISVSQFVNEFRIKEACDLLRKTDRSVLEISLASGFATKSNFNREFARITGQSPSQWRSNAP